MPFRLPSEIVADRFVPTARAMLAAELDARGLSQQTIADHLGVSQPAVSNYAGGDVRIEERFSEDPRMAATIERVADGLAAKEMDGYEVLSELVGLVREFEDRGPICEIHERETPELRGLGCDLCIRGPDEAVLEERAVLRRVRKAARIVARTPGMAAFVPSVGTNIGETIAEPAEESDVAAIPGRIYAVGGRVEVPAHPEFGASRHVARTILAARTVDPDVRAALNLTTDDRLLDAAREQAVETLEFDAEYAERGEHLRERFAERGVARVLFHRGAFGIEPITYVLGETAIGAAESAADLVRATQATE